jgi:hypothetical protein
MANIKVKKLNKVVEIDEAEFPAFKAKGYEKINAVAGAVKKTTTRKVATKKGDA